MEAESQSVILHDASPITNIQACAKMELPSVSVSSDQNYWPICIGHCGRERCIFFLINLFVAVLGLRFCVWALSSCGEWGPHFIAVRRPLTVVASLVAEHRLRTHRLSSCGSRAQLLCGMWDLPRPGLEPMSPALAGGFSTTAPPGKPREAFLIH